MVHPAVLSQRRRVLVVSQYGAGGFYRVARSILAPLAGRFEIHYLGIGEPCRSRREDGIVVHANSRTGELLGDLAALAARLRPEVLFVVHALHVVGPICGVFAGRRPRPALVAYFPVEGRILRPQTLSPLAELDRAVVYNAHARDEVERHLPALDDGVAGSRIEIVPHGLDHRLFAPLTAAGDRERCRRARARLFPDRPELAEAFIVLNGNDTVPRKRLDITLWGFADFARDKPPDVYLHLHRAGPGRAEWDELRTLAARLGIAERLLPASGDGAGGTLSDERLNLVYNACELGVNTSMAEGWGLVSFEHAATGAAQIVPRHSGLEQMWGGAARPLPTRSRLRQERDVEMDVVPSSALSLALEELYGDPPELARRSRDARERAALEWPWSAVAERFGRIFEEVGR